MATMPNTVVVIAAGLANIFIVVRVSSLPVQARLTKVPDYTLQQLAGQPKSYRNPRKTLLAEKLV
jgi:hypothetical protein